MQNIIPGQFYRHFKNRLYQIVALAEHSETGEKLVVYQALYGDYRVYARPYEMFISEVDRKKYPEAEQKYRFELVDPGKEAENVKGMKQGDEAECENMVNPVLLEFLDADTLEEKMHILALYRNKMDESLLNSIAISLDLVVEKDSVQEQYDEIMNCLSMMQKFECDRFR